MVRWVWNEFSVLSSLEWEKILHRFCCLCFGFGERMRNTICILKNVSLSRMYSRTKGWRPCWKRFPWSKKEVTDKNGDEMLMWHNVDRNSKLGKEVSLWMWLSVALWQDISWGDVARCLLTPHRHWQQTTETVLPKSSLVNYEFIQATHRGLGEGWLTGVRVTERYHWRAHPTWVTIHDSCIPAAPRTPGRHLHPRLLSPPSVYSFYSLREGPCEASNFLCLLSLVSFINFLSLLSSRRECFNLKETAKDLVLDQGDVTLDSMSWSTRKEGKKE